mmetsp:Transcript_146670/g.258525  ORF Transcript_146670/g.258525 Transcript_146670/m.258525 type:complete len:214 (-) Transcript_146670:50-691(-)
MLSCTKAFPGCVSLLFLLLKDVVNVSAMGRSPELYIEPLPRTLPSSGRGLHPPQLPLTGSLQRTPPGFLDMSGRRPHRKVPFFELAALHWSRSLKMPESLLDLNIVGGAQVWAFIVAVLVLIWVVRMVACPYSLDLPLPIAMGSTRQARVRPSEHSEQTCRLIKELESAVQGARLPKGLQRKENGTKPISPCRTPPEEEIRSHGPYLQVAGEF